jgi:hypothetical protein
LFADSALQLWFSGGLPLFELIQISYPADTGQNHYQAKNHAAEKKIVYAPLKH